MTESALLQRLNERCGPAAVVPPARFAQRVMPMGGERMPAALLLCPANTDELSFMVSQTAAVGRALIAMGGGTALRGGLRPVTGREWYLSLERMDRIERMDPRARLAVVQAGATVQSLQSAAADLGMQFAVDAAAGGQATLGGAIATNAGGRRVQRFGTLREQVLGLEVVLADGTVLDLMDEVLTNNAGFDLRQLFIGSEGCLGIVTRAVLRLRPLSGSRTTGLLELSTLNQLPALLDCVEAGLGGSLSVFELMWPEFMALMTEGAGAARRAPLPAGAAGYVLVEAEGADPVQDGARFRVLLEGLKDEGLISDATVAHDDGERAALWSLRCDTTHLLERLNPAETFEVSVPTDTLADCVQEILVKLRLRWPQADVVASSSVADNSLHLVVNLGPDMASQHEAVSVIVHDSVARRHGSIAASGGIGLDRRQALQSVRPAPVLAMMRRLKECLDPEQRLNPGKVLTLN